MKTNNIFKLTYLLILVLILSSVLFAQEAGKNFEKALFIEESEGNLEKAISLYEKLVKEPGGNTAIAAKAQFHIGLCYEKLGKTEAVKAYDKVINQFPNEVEWVAEAKKRITKLVEEESKSLTRTMLLPPGIYMECQTLSPDGKYVTGIDFSKGQNLVLYDLSTKKTKFLTDYNWEGKFPYAYVPVWSSDSKEIAYQGGLADTSECELFIMNLKGESRFIFKNPHGILAPCKWFSDNDAILIVMKNEGGSSSLGLVDVKDGKYKEICTLQIVYQGPGDTPQAKAAASADISPDGRFVVFSDGPSESNRDIYLVSIDGKNKTALIDNAADDKDPRWSPDGKHIVFLSNRNGNWDLWSAAINDDNTAGTPTMILEGGEDCELGPWTERGIILNSQLIMIDTYVLEVDSESYTVLKKPTTLVALLSTPEFDMRPLWSPDGKYLSLLSYFRKSKSNERFLTILANDGKEFKKFKFNPPVKPSGGTGRWLPDGSGFGTIIWDADKKLYLYIDEMKTGETKTESIPVGEFTFPRPLTFAWSGDNISFFYFRRGEDKTQPGIVEHTIATGIERYLLKAKKDDYFSLSLKLSHDNKRLAFDWNGRLAILDIVTGNFNKLKYDEKIELHNPTWSPEDKYLLVKGYPEGGRDYNYNELFLFSISDGKIIKLDISRYLPKDSRIITSQEWSPDGKKIAFDLGIWKADAELISNLIPAKQ